MASRKSPVGAPAGILAPRIQAALVQLIEAYRYAQDVDRDVWDFAVEMGSLSALGLTRSDLRWLVCKGYVEHAREVTQPGEGGRAFRSTGNLTFRKRSCFVLTQAGAALARNVSATAAITPKPRATEASKDAEDRPQPPAPNWDPDRHELRLDGKLVKQYRLPSPNQETILMAFQEEGWPAVIDDPLPPQPKQDPKRRLHDTVKSLNRNQKNRLIRFLGNGTGQGVRWELIEPAVSRNPR